jgi:hypothetical protein
MPTDFDPAARLARSTALSMPAVTKISADLPCGAS